MQLTMYAMAAQEESVSTANNIRWSIQKRMASGEFVGSVAPYGYGFENGELKIKLPEAETVRMIFNLYLSGKGQREIVQYLNNNNVPFSHGKKWMRSCIKIILSNERYTGNALLQKKFVQDTLTHRLVVNKGERQQYFVENHHEAIISKEMYEAARQLAANRNKKQEQARHMFTHRIICPDCGRHFREVTSSGKSYWTCPNRANGSKSCTYYNYSEKLIIMCATTMMVKLYLYMDQCLPSIFALLREIEYTQTGTDTKLFELDQSIAALNDKRSFWGL